ncbi:hypothetical protein ACFWN7_07040 [Agromyces sp. NPDC058484]|uniref:hypothetical protein n=1 Tax=Agromyces sp. NPDC058484 TaxID=3346524 RepID=UPI00364B1FB0
MTLSTWIAIASAVVAGISAYIAWRAHKNVGLYKDAFFKLDPLLPSDYFAIQFRLVNTGETSARDVDLVLEVDPTHLRTSNVDGAASTDPKWTLIEPGEAGVVHFTIADTTGSEILAAESFDMDIAANPKRNKGTVTFTNVLGRRRTQTVTIPRVAGAWKRDMNALVDRLREQGH